MNSLGRVNNDCMARGNVRSNFVGMAPTIGGVHLARLLGEWDRGSDSLHSQLAARIHELVRSGSLPTGIRLPSERSLGSALSVSRNTVAYAFDHLRGTGVLSSRQGDGTYVSMGRSHSSLRGDGRLQSFVVERQGGVRGILDLRSAALPGLPIVAEELDRMSGLDIAPFLQSHGYLPAGLPSLRSAVAEYYSDLGLPTDPAQILITSGAQQALRLAAESVLRPGKIVLIEDPSFRGAIESLRALGANLVPIPSGASGIDTEKLEEQVQRWKPSLIVVQSTVHNPSGSVLSAHRRQRVADIAATQRIPVIDDSTPSDAIFADQPPTPLAAFGPGIITVGSASKSFWGGLRVGWLRADPDLVEGLASVKNGEDLGTSLVAQTLTARLLPRIQEARAARRAALEPARAAVLELIERVAPEWEPTHPQGGASLWIRLPSASASDFSRRAARAGVLVFPGPTFSPVNELDDHIRISFAGDLNETLGGIQLLARVWDDMSKRVV